MNRFPRVAALMCSFFAAGPIWSAPQADAVGTPGVVPHPIADYLPITIDKNMCLMCHRKASGSVAQKGEIPLSHFKAGKLPASAMNARSAMRRAQVQENLHRLTLMTLFTKAQKQASARTDAC